MDHRSRLLWITVDEKPFVKPKSLESLFSKHSDAHFERQRNLEWSYLTKPRGNTSKLLDLLG